MEEWYFFFIILKLISFTVLYKVGFRSIDFYQLKEFFIYLVEFIEEEIEDLKG